MVNNHVYKNLVEFSSPFGEASPFLKEKKNSFFQQMSAAAFAKGLLDLEGQLTPILVCVLFLKFSACSLGWIFFQLRGSSILKVSLVSKDSSMLDGLDNASIEMEEAKVSNLFLIFLLLYLWNIACWVINSNYYIKKFLW